MPLHFWWKKSFAPLTNSFWSFKIRIKSYLSKRKNFCFSSKIWGRFAFTFCRYLTSVYEGIYLLQVVSIRIWGYLPSAGKYPQILREISVYFSDEVFSLRIWGHFIQQCREMAAGYKKLAFPLWPSIYHVSIILSFFYPPTHYVSINTVLNVSKTDHFLDPPSPFADVI